MEWDKVIAIICIFGSIAIITSASVVISHKTIESNNKCKIECFQQKYPIEKCAEICK